MKTVSHYYAIVHKDPESAFGLTFPDLPGCFSAADSFEDIFSNAIEAIELWMEDAEQVPSARSIEEIRKEAAEDLAEGAFLVAVPHIRNAGRKVSANISMDRGMLEAVDATARMLNLTRSAFLVQAAQNEIEGRHLAGTE